MALTIGEVNKQLWDEELTRLLNLSTATIKRNSELESRLTELEIELAVWKRAHSELRDAAERENEAHKVQIATLNKQLSCADNYPGQCSLVLCVINGDRHVFSQSFIIQGQQGGRSAAQELTRGIAEYLTNDGIQIISNRLSFWVTIFYNRRSLVNTLMAHNVCDGEQLDTFLLGFSQASPRFLLVDVGSEKEGTSVKIREYIETYSRFPQTLRIFLGCYDTTYTPVFNSLEHDQCLGKCVMIRGPLADVDSLQSLPLPLMKIDGLFMDQVPSQVPKRPTPLVMTGINTVSTNGGLISPQSPARTGSRFIDPSLPLHKQVPPPCNEHYLMTCSKGPTLCKYSHDYILTPEQLASLASNAKKAPCNWLKNGLQCPHGDRCCWGHICPNGSRCIHLSKGKCWFKGADMHPFRQDPLLECT